MRLKTIIRSGISCLRIPVLKLMYHTSFRIKGTPISLPFCISISNGKIEMGKRINILKGTHIASVDGGTIIIGDGVYFNRNCEIVSRDRIEIGEGCRFGPNVCVYDHNHVYDYNGVKDEYKTAETIIGQYCWIGANSVIVKGSTIGEKSVIAAGTIVHGFIPPHSLVLPSDNLRIHPINCN